MPSEHWEIARNVVEAAVEAQERGLKYSWAMWHTNQCEVCGSTEHKSYHCCDRCNYDRHTCHFCGDNLGHHEVSACYLLMHVEENRLVPSEEVIRGWIEAATKGKSEA